MRIGLVVSIVAIMFILGIMANVIYFNKIIPTLGKYEKNSFYEMLPSKQWKQIKKYKKLCEEHNLPKWHAYFMMLCPFILALLFLIFIFIDK